MDMQKIVTLDGFGVRGDPREHFVKNATLSKSQLRCYTFEDFSTTLRFVCLRGPRISILGLISFEL